jgi:hypothetical protein
VSGEDLRQRYAEALAEKFTWPAFKAQIGRYPDVVKPETAELTGKYMRAFFVDDSGHPGFRPVICNEAAEVCAAVRDEEMEALRSQLPQCNGLCLNASDVLDDLSRVVGNPVARAHRSCPLHGDLEAAAWELDAALTRAESERDGWRERAANAEARNARQRESIIAYRVDAQESAETVARLRDLTATCSCSPNPETYEGPEADCPIHGAIRALNKAMAEAERLRGQVAEYETCITWDTICKGCASTLNQSIRETERAAKAEAALALTRERLDALIAAGFGATTDTLRELRAALDAQEADRG